MWCATWCGGATLFHPFMRLYLQLPAARGSRLRLAGTLPPRSDNGPVPHVFPTLKPMPLLYMCGANMPHRHYSTARHARAVAPIFSQHPSTPFRTRPHPSAPFTPTASGKMAPKKAVSDGAKIPVTVGGVREGVAHAPKLKDAQEGCAGAVTGEA